MTWVRIHSLQHIITTVIMSLSVEEQNHYTCPPVGCIHGNCSLLAYKITWSSWNHMTYLRISFNLSGSQFLYFSNSADNCCRWDVTSSSLVNVASRSACCAFINIETHTKPYNHTESSRPWLADLIPSSRAVIFLSDWTNCSLRSDSLRFL